MARLCGWPAGWSDLMAFEIVPVVEGKDTAQALSGDSLIRRGVISSYPPAAHRLHDP